jgi:hypothetical protein
MSRTLGAAAAAAFALALPVHADEPPVDGPVVVADRAFELPVVPPIPRKAKKDWLHALADHVDEARTALEGHALVVTSGDSKARTFTYDDLVKSLKPKDAKQPVARAPEP